MVRRVECKEAGLLFRGGRGSIAAARQVALQNTALLHVRPLMFIWLLVWLTPHHIPSVLDSNRDVGGGTNCDGSMAQGDATGRAS